MRERLCKCCRKWHEVDNWPSECYVIVEHAKSDTFKAPYFLRDAFDDPVQSMADGRMYSSKAALRATYRPSGNPQGESYAEVGTEQIREPPKQKSTVMESLKRVKDQMGI